jgi:hypothetical protein
MPQKQKAPQIIICRAFERFDVFSTTEALAEVV